MRARHLSFKRKDSTLSDVALCENEMGKRQLSKSEWDTGVSDLMAFKLDHLQTVKLILFRKMSTLLFSLPYIINHFLLPQREEGRKGQGLKRGHGNSRKVNETQGFLTLGHSNWTICSLLSWFCSIKFPTFSLSFWGVQFLITPGRGRKEAAGAEMGKWDSPKSEWDTGVSDPGAFKLDYLQPVKQILFQRIFTLLLSLP